MAFAHNNVYMSVDWAKSEEETVQLVRQIVLALDAGKSYVTRGEKMKVPRIVSAGLPARIHAGQKAVGKIALADVNPAQALFGADWDLASPAATHIKPGAECSVTFRASRYPEETGEKTFALVVASPMNVTTSKELRVVVEP